VQRPSPLITAAELADHLAGDDPPALLDVRWALNGPTGREAYRVGHLPGAVYVDLDTELAAPVGPGTGRHPLPSIEDLQSAARAWGLRAGQPVVVYDDTSGLAAARAWWLLSWAGLSDVRVLDGGVTAWTDEGRPLTDEQVHPLAGDITLTSGRLPVLDAAAAASFPATGVLLDARSGERFRGEVEPIDAVAGHIPGARSAPTTENLAVDGRFLDPAALRQRFAVLGIDPSTEVGVYCGSGVTAAHQALALAVAGYPSSLYPGSWSEWIDDPSHPIATGDDAV
jgi:thiosulfate/3-mercaptopyruvate sulfurtransferase